jgi:activator of HSP90 ATPase
MARTIQQTVHFDLVTPDELFETYVDSKKHAAAVGASVTIDRVAGATFRAFGGGVTGTNLVVVPRSMIVQTWRGTPWKESDLDSILILTFSESAVGGAQIDLVQAQVPDHAFDLIDEGWHRMYWQPWKAHFFAQRRA